MKINIFPSTSLNVMFHAMLHNNFVYIKIIARHSMNDKSYFKNSQNGKHTFYSFDIWHKNYESGEISTKNLPGISGA